jgi:hypothetical protein
VSVQLICGNECHSARDRWPAKSPGSRFRDGSLLLASRAVEQDAPTRSRLAQTARSGMLLVVLVEITGVLALRIPNHWGGREPSVHLQHCGRRRLPLYRLRRLVPLQLTAGGLLILRTAVSNPPLSGLRAGNSN